MYSLDSLNTSDNADAVMNVLNEVAGAQANLDTTSLSEGVNYSSRAPWLDPPDGSDPFDQQAVISLPAAPSGDVVGIVLIVPDGYDGVIDGISFNFLGGGSPNGTGNIVYRLEADGRPIRNFDNMLVEKGTSNTPRDIDPIRIYSGQTITGIVNHTADNTLTGNVAWSLRGYFYPNTAA